jgi:hypothetical protein
VATIAYAHSQHLVNAHALILPLLLLLLLLLLILLPTTTLKKSEQNPLFEKMLNIPHPWSPLLHATKDWEFLCLFHLIWYSIPSKVVINFSVYSFLIYKLFFNFNSNRATYNNFLGCSGIDFDNVQWFVFFQFLTPFTLGGHNFVISNLFLTIVSVLDVPRGAKRRDLNFVWTPEATEPSPWI